VSRAGEFRQLHRPGRPLLLPNAWDLASGALFAAAGFAAIGTTSLGVAAASGKPDGVAATRDETVALAGRLTRLPCLVTVDLEGGFDDEPAAVAELTQSLYLAGVVGVNLEDGRGDGTLAPVARQRAVIAAVKATTPDVFVNARTDTFWLAPRPPGSLDETLRRLSAYAEAGADGVFVPGLADPARIGQLVEAVDRPLNVLINPAGPPLAQLADLGVARVSCGSLLFRAAMTGAMRALDAVAAGGAGPTDLLTYADIQHLAEHAEWDGAGTS
jgi:2-methylisocitrate lyase-like PEP mutase family enzyme